ncbi:hypothetical protein EDC01DRAFT_592324, partial [Geopyxis carbonaria]
FRSVARMYPETFDALHSRISNHRIFENNSTNSEQQLPVDVQLLIALKRFGTYGNAASLLNVALWAGVGEGTVVLCTKRVMRAVLDSSLRPESVCWPTSEQRERHKAHVEANVCASWRDGWLMIDGTLVPLFERPYYYGEAFFDRKSNYSLNVQ